MTRDRTIASVLTSVLIAAALAIAATWEAPSAAAQRRTVYAISGAGFCTTSDGGECTVAAAVTIDRTGNANGAFLLSFGSPRSRLIVSAKTGVVEPAGDGLRATLEGPAVVEAVEHDAAHVVQQYQRAVLDFIEGGTVALTLEDTTIVTMIVLGGVSIRALPASGDTSTHEVGHWMGLYHGPAGMEPPIIGFGFVTMGSDIEGLPEIAGLFRDTAEGETGHAHGHLDYLKKVGDPATHAPLGFEARGDVACVFQSGRQTSSGVRLSVDLAAALLEFRAPRCGIREVLSIRELPCPQPCRATVLIGEAPVSGRENF